MSSIFYFYLLLKQKIYFSRKALPAFKMSRQLAKADVPDKRTDHKPFVKLADKLWFESCLTSADESRLIEFDRFNKHQFSDRLTIMLLLKFTTGLILGWEAKEYQKYSGDFFVGFIFATGLVLYERGDSRCPTLGSDNACH